MPSPDPREAYAGLPVMIWAAGPDLGWEYCNPCRLEFTGRPLEDELGRGWIDRVHAEDREATLAACRAGSETREPFRLGYRLQRADGEYRWMSDTVVPRLDPEGRVLGFVGCSTDVTEQHALRQRIERLQRTDAIAQLTGGIAHDFNNLLTGILGHVTLLREDASLSLEARGDLAQIQRAADRAAGLTRQLFAFSRRQAPAPRPLDLNRVVSGSVTALRSMVGSRIDVIQVLAPDLDPVLADPAQLELVLLQLGNHARRAMPDGGLLELQTESVRLDAAAAAGHPGLAPGDYVTLAVRDTGAGDARPVQEDPPLTSVYGVVKQAGGYIAVDSRPGVGTTFTIYLRRLEERPAGGGAEEVPGAGAAGTGTVLLVEDEEQVRELARRVLERAGYTVLATADAEAAMAIADRHPGHIHLLVTDVVLPRVSGRELAARLGIHRPAIKVLYVSGTADEAIARHRVLEPGTEFLEKPFSLEGLLRKVRQILGAPESTPRPA